jgi:hypothetical protein
MIFGRKKKEDKLQEKQVQPTPPKKEIKFDVTLTLWDGKKLDTTVLAQFPVDFKEMAKNVIRDGLFMNDEQIVRVNEVQLTKNKEVEGVLK